MAKRQTFVVVGGGLAGQRAVETLREQGFDGAVTLIGAEDDRPYDRPPLSKDCLQGARPLEEIYYQPVEWYRDQGVELRTGVAASALDAPRRRVRLADGSELPYDACLIATGAGARRLAVPGSELEGIHYLRSRRDAARIREEMQPGRRVVVVGAGFIGAEVAASCRTLGLSVTMIEALPVPLGRVLGDELGRVYADIHREHGVTLYTGATVAAFRGSGRVEQVVTGSGRRVDCDFVVVGIGVEPQVGWLAGSGVRLGDGVVVDRLCATGVPGVYAAGDVACWPYGRRGELVRVEHWDHAASQGAAAALAMLGRGTPYDAEPYFWSDQYDLTLEYVGHARSWDAIVLEGAPATHRFAAFYLLGGRVVACLAMGRPEAIERGRGLIRSGYPLTPEQSRGAAGPHRKAG